MNKNTLRTGTVMALALSALLTGQVWAGGVDTTVAREYVSPIDNSVDIQLIMDIANDPSLKLPSRTKVATIEDSARRLYLTQILDSAEAAKNIDQMTEVEIDQLASQVFGRVAAFGAGLEASGGTSSASTSCVQTCFNELLHNTHNGTCSFGCRFAFSLLFELCAADCLIDVTLSN